MEGWGGSSRGGWVKVGGVEWIIQGWDGVGEN